MNQRLRLLLAYKYEIVLINGGTETIETTGDLIVMQEVH
jgi:hypothetical protein